MFLKSSVLLLAGIFVWSGCSPKKDQDSQATYVNAEEERLGSLKNLMQAFGPQEAFRRLKQGQDLQDLSHIEAVPGYSMVNIEGSGQSPMVCIVNGEADLIVGGSNPNSIGKDLEKNKIIEELICRLRRAKKEGREAKTHIDFLDFQGHKKRFTVWGKRSFLGENTTYEPQFMCGIISASLDFRKDKEAPCLK